MEDGDGGGYSYTHGNNHDDGDMVINYSDYIDDSDNGGGSYYGDCNGGDDCSDDW